MKQSADNNFVNAQVYYANLIYNGKVKGQSKDKSISYYKMAAEKGNHEAGFILGKIYYNGELVPKDLTVALDFFLENTNNSDNGEEEYYLALVLCEKHKNDKNANLRYAADLCTIAIEKGFLPANDLWKKYNLESYMWLNPLDRIYDNH
jgi:TPR repeat protein